MTDRRHGANRARMKATRGALFRLKAELRGARALVADLTREWRLADYHWMLEFRPVTERSEDWIPGNRGLVARVESFLKVDRLPVHPDCPNSEHVTRDVCLDAWRPVDERPVTCRQTSSVTCESRETAVGEGGL